jgi:hypothetical protein
MAREIHISLMRQQRRDIFGVVEAERFDPNEFGWVETVEGGAIPIHGVKLVHNPTGSYFEFTSELEWDSSKQIMKWSPGKDAQTDKSSVQSWSAQLDRVTEWLRSIRAEFYDPDPWDALPDLTTSGAASDTTFFSEDERTALSQRLREIAVFIGEQRGLSEPEQEEVEYRFVLPLEDASSKVTRGQWKLMFYGALVTEGVHMGFASPLWGVIARTAAQSITHFFGIPLPELPAGS